MEVDTYLAQEQFERQSRPRKPMWPIAHAARPDKRRRAPLSASPKRSAGTMSPSRNDLRRWTSN